MKSFALIFLAPVFAFATSTYNCTAVVSEEVKLVQIHYKTPTDGTKIDYKKGIPANLVLETNVINPELFTPNYDKNQYSVDEGNSEGWAMYTLDYKHAPIHFTFNTEVKTSNCNPNVPYTNQCELEVTYQGKTDTFWETNLTPKDVTAVKSTFSVGTSIYMDTKNGKLNFQTDFLRTNFISQNGVFYSASAKNAYVGLPENIDTTTYLGTGLIDNQNPKASDPATGDSKTDTLEMTCELQK